jgi:prepilin-type N-terminal cleavage/methylation domain-containing protein
MELTPPSGRDGFTLVEVMIALMLAGMLAMAAAAAYSSVLRLQYGILTRWPADAAADAAVLVVAEQLSAATCLVEPGAGTSGKFLSARTGADCSGAPLSSAPAGFVASCLDGADRLVFWRGTGSAPAAGACPPASDYYVLSPGRVKVTGNFSRASGDEGAVVASLLFEGPPGADGKRAYSVSRAAHIAISGPVINP